MRSRCCSTFLTGALRLVSLGTLSALLLLMMSGAQNPPPAAPSAPTGAGPMDLPLRLIAEARQSYQGVQDYTCLFIKRERLREQIQPEHLIAMKVRTQPFSVYLRWLRPAPTAGQEVCYVAGRNNGMMRVHSTGLRGVVGFVSMDPRDPRALETSRHTITEAGIGNLIDRFGKAWELESRLNRTQVRVQEYEANSRRCLRVETVHTDPAGQQIPFYRSVVYFDKQNHLPIRVENYDWPRPGFDPAGAIVESYSYLDLHLNTGLSEAVFVH
ncbi:MAG TPA: DUF1571 domain-containing protein [Gemmataceae bacterium]|nr:DUF1571 domain-containing protein [Gemmataceae bacterium]